MLHGAFIALQWLERDRVMRYRILNRSLQNNTNNYCVIVVCHDTYENELLWWVLCIFLTRLIGIDFAGTFRARNWLRLALTYVHIYFPLCFSSSSFCSVWVIATPWNNDTLWVSLSNSKASSNTQRNDIFYIHEMFLWIQFKMGQRFHAGYVNFVYKRGKARDFATDTINARAKRKTTYLQP